MNTIKWLQKYAPGFHELSKPERQEISDFLFLWSLFEAKVLNEHGNVDAIIASSERWAENGQLTEETFGRELFYFRSRYVVDGQFSHHFDHLHLPDNHVAQLVRRVLHGDDGTPKNFAASVLIIVYRFRNNLFHGRKWSYELGGQLNNFIQANNALMRAIELHTEGTSGTQT